MLVKLHILYHHLYYDDSLVRCSDGLSLRNPIDRLVNNNILPQIEKIVPILEMTRAYGLRPRL